jgi:hypothetical protein
MSKRCIMHEDEILTSMSNSMPYNITKQFPFNYSMIGQKFGRISFLLIFTAFVLAFEATTVFSQGDVPTPPSSPPPPPPAPIPQPVVPNYQNLTEGGASCAIASGADIISYFATHGYPGLMPAGTTVTSLENSLKSLGIGTDPKNALKTYIDQHGDGLNVNSIDPQSFSAISPVIAQGGMIFLGLTSPGLPSHAVVLENAISGDTTYIGISDINSPPTTHNPVTVADYPSTGDFACAITGTDGLGNATTVQYYRVEVDNTAHAFWFWYRGTDTWHRYDATAMIAITPIPEPTPLALLGTAVIMSCALLRKRAKQA